MGFQCRQFYLKDDRCAMKVSTDSLLLGGWVRTAGVNYAADFGCGCGILALMLAQRTDANARIDAYEYDAAATQQATENVHNSPWPDKVSVQQTDVLTFADPSYRYDLVIMNPPYFAAHLSSANSQRQLARQGAEQEIWQPWLARAAQLLAPHGRIALVAPQQALARIIDATHSIQTPLAIIRRCNVRSVPQRPPYLVLLELTRQGCEQELELEELTIREENKYTDAFLQYTGAFYLKGTGN
ncbi:tRNA1(Val) (adenine(37)-N6)-methyltransferase [Pseudidiomarina donghaiensis]|uniref:tRNA (Adenosine(37)-N6)-methyltransferase TrmM n=1 Tax=Pseudidiomarina donghaiensis TaxID=519452 RepID=A0A432XFU7_9GAMM|nr:methyltransferase [Pseudidiomarina donghaiensis]RUO47492.1 tRNA (adenosine(37)-N6)-methyltransferase TrmM [Pseudidiomarina donghaiensis]SFV23153.1 tRNA1Val (adenine37-N6)-methyltransferase [Pseudidiomarina donghaiensis]